MTVRKLPLTEGAAILLMLSLALLIVGFASHLFQVFSFPWIAWCALGGGALVTFGRELIMVRDPIDGPAAGKLESAVNSAIVIVLLSTPALLAVSTIVLTLLYASAGTFGLLPTVVSVIALYAMVKHALRS